MIHYCSECRDGLFKYYSKIFEVQEGYTDKNSWCGEGWPIYYQECETCGLRSSGRVKESQLNAGL